MRNRDVNGVEVGALFVDRLYCRAVDDSPCKRGIPT